MDKLQPIIKHRFWILAGLALPLMFFGYFKANGALKAATEQREKELDGVKSGVSDGRTANEDYVQALSHINQFYEVSVNEAIADLWRTQEELMTWPALAQGRVPDQFLGDFDIDVCTLYKLQYPKEVSLLERRVEPVMPLVNAGSNEIGNIRRENSDTIDMSRVPWKQKVILAADLPQAQFGQFEITSKEMWDAQIDIWLVDRLFESIRRINRDKESVSESVVRRLERLEFMGGTGEPMYFNAGEGDSGGGAQSAMSQQMVSMLAGAMGGGGQTMSAMAFKPEEEFGDATDTEALVDPSAGGMEAMMMSYVQGALAGSGVGGVGGPKIRYIADSDDKPYLERGFYMSVIILQNEIPQFLLELTNSPWPTRIERFSVGASPYRPDDLPISSSVLAQAGFGGGENQAALLSMLASGSSGINIQGLGGMGNLSSRFNSYSQQSQAGRNRLSKDLPEFAEEALKHPDLVQLDLAGVITIYKQPEIVLAEASSSETEAAGMEPSADLGVEAEANAIEEAPVSDPASSADDAAVEESAAESEVPGEF